MDMQSLFHHCVKLRQTAAGYYPARFTGGQFIYWDTLDPMWRATARCNAGATLSFFTDDVDIELEYVVKNCFCGPVVFDIYENDVLTEVIQRGREKGPGKWRYRRRYAESISKITIYLPYGCELYISRIGVENYMPAPRPEGPTILAMGDSITQGQQAVSPSLTYTGFLQRSLDATVINQGMAGYHFDARTIPDDLPFQPDIITVAYGTNDYSLIPHEKVAVQVPQYFDQLQQLYPETPVYIITPIWRGDLDENERTAPRFQRFRYFLEKQAESHNFQVIEGDRLVPHLPQFFADGALHPNEMGFAIYGAELARQLQHQAF